MGLTLGRVPAAIASNRGMCVMVMFHGNRGFGGCQRRGLSCTGSAPLRCSGECGVDDAGPAVHLWHECCFIVPSGGTSLNGRRTSASGLGKRRRLWSPGAPDHPVDPQVVDASGACPSRTGRDTGAESPFAPCTTGQGGLAPLWCGAQEPGAVALPPRDGMVLVFFPIGVAVPLGGAPRDTQGLRNRPDAPQQGLRRPGR